MKTKVSVLARVLAVSLFVALVFFSYLYFIGIPKTKARHFYNLGETYVRLNNKELAAQYFKDALKYWREGYIVDALDDLETVEYKEL